MSAALAPVHLPEPALRSVTAQVTGGLDGALRVAVLLRSRGYRVHDLTLHVGEGAAASRVTATAVVTPDELDLLVARVSRLPVVVSAHAG